MKKHKRIFAFVLAALSVFALAGIAMAEMVEIGTPGDLAAFRDRVNKGETTLDAKLTANINLSGVHWKPIGQHIPVTPGDNSSTISADYSYKGTFDGAGYTVTNFTITSADAVNAYVPLGSSTNYYMEIAAGFFGVLSADAEILNLRVEDFSVGLPVWAGDFYVFGGGIVGVNFGGWIENVAVSSADIILKNCAGGVAGWNNGTVVNCSVQGAVEITTEFTSSSGGGVVGYNYTGGTVASCSVSGAVKIEGTYYDAGGVVGNNAGAVTNCSASGIPNIKATDTGGVVGQNAGTVSDSYAQNIGLMEKSSGESAAGGVVGYNTSQGVVRNCFAREIGTLYSIEGSGGLVGFSNGVKIENCVLLAGEAQTVLSSDKKCEGGVLGYATILSQVQNCLYPSANVIFQNSKEDKPIGNFPLASMNAAYNVTSYDVNAASGALPAIAAMIAQGISVTIEKGKTISLDVTTLPGTLGIGGMTFTWTTEDAGVAAVSPGAGTAVSLTGVGAGTANVTCTISGSLEAELICAVTVVEANGFISSFSAEPVSAGRNTPGVLISASTTGIVSYLVWEQVSGGDVLKTGDLSSGFATTTAGVVRGGSYTYRAKGVVTYGYDVFSGDIYSTPVVVNVPDVKASDIGVIADSLPIPIREGDSAEITYTLSNDSYPVTSVGSADVSGLTGSGFTVKSIGAAQVVLATASAVKGNYSAGFDVIAGGMWIGPVGVSLDVLRAADSNDVRLMGNSVLQNIRIGDIIDESYTAEKTAAADDLNDRDAGVGNIVSSANWDDSGLSVDVVSQDTFTVSGTAGAPGVYELFVDLKLGAHKVSTESISFTISARPEEVTVTPDEDMEDILHGDNVNATISFGLEEFPDAEIIVTGVDGTSDNWNESNLLVTVGPDGKTVSVIGAAGVPGEYEITVQLEINGAPVEITIPVVIAAKPEDVIVTPDGEATDPENITEGDSVDIIYDFGSSIPGAIVELIDANGMEGWDLSGLEITVNPDGTISITGTAKTPGDYTINVQLTVNGVPVEDVQILLSILGKETPAWSKGNDGCSAADAGLLALALLPFVYIRKRNK